jgi:putative phosphoribosyl transferase
MFADRQDAGSQLAARLLRFKDQRPVVLALPRGGVPVAFEVATVLAAPLDLVLVRKIGVPFQPELAVAAVVDGEHPQTVVNQVVVDLVQLPEDYLKDESARQLEEIERRRRLYLAGRPRVDVAGCTAIVIDDGIATGATVRAALLAIRRGRPERLVLAVPVAPRITIEALQADVDEVVCLDAPLDFAAISQFYGDFHQVTDAEVIELLKRAAAPVT